MAQQVSVLMKRLMRRVINYLNDMENAKSRSDNVFGVWTQNKKDVEKDFIADLKAYTKTAVMLGNKEVLAMCQMQAKKAKESLVDDLDEIINAEVEDGD